MNRLIHRTSPVKIGANFDFSVIVTSSNQQSWMNFWLIHCKKHPICSFMNCQLTRNLIGTLLRDNRGNTSYIIPLCRGHFNLVSTGNHITTSANTIFVRY